MRIKNCCYFFLFVGFLLMNFIGFSQEKGIWSALNKIDSSEELIDKKVILNKQKFFALDINKLKSNLLSLQKSNKATQIVEFPDAEGNLIKYKVSETSLLHPDLAQKFPSIKSYRGEEVTDRTSTIHFTINALGLYAMMLSPKKGTIFIDPYTRNRKKYNVYYKKDASTQKRIECLTENSISIKPIDKGFKNTNTTDLKLRTFRLAIATTIEYSNFHVDAAGVGVGSTRTDSINAVMSGISVTMVRVNPIFERDVAITMQLVANNDQLIFLETDPGTDPYTNDNGSAMLAQNKTTINSIIGLENYDIGHVFSTGGGGVANLASVCTSSKAGGVTGSDFPVGDSFDVDYVTHEMGHQYGANHTFNGTAANCANGNRNNETAVEPGSGSTVMAYAGICSPQNVQGNSDAYFHIISIAEIVNNYTSGNGQCATISDFALNLNLPTVNAGSDFMIPKSTPFVLRGQGADADGNVLTYCWEQIDNEVVGIDIPPSSTQTVGAIFRSYPPTMEANRYFPNLSTLASGSPSTWEVLPSVSRTINFSLAVRDNVVGEGEVIADNNQITVNDVAGPFVVTSQNTAGILWTENDSQLITWDVAGTDANGIDESNVNIFMSTDGGLTFPILLASNTPNDGSENIIVPNTPSPNVRIMVQAVSNIFFAINSENISIGTFETICTTFQAVDVPKLIPDVTPSGVISTINITDNFLISDVNLSLDITHTWLWDLQIYLKAPNGTEVLVYDRSCGSSGTQTEDINAVFDDEASGIICDNAVPAINGVTKPANLLAGFNGLQSVGDWELRVVDNSSGDIGTINNWALELCQTNPVVKVDDFSFQQLSIYPNPFNDRIHVSFTSDTMEDVSISLFDISGRKITNYKFTNQSNTFNKELNFSRLALGVYILNIQKGHAKTSKRIIKY